MKKTLLVLACMVSAQLAVAMNEKIIMPGKQVLQERLGAIHMAHFAERSQIIDTLADQQRLPMGIVIDLERAISTYFNYIKTQMSEQDVIIIRMTMNKSSILEALLQDAPQALVQLEQLGFYQPDKN